jgi:hypothetical protein
MLFADTMGVDMSSWVKTGSNSIDPDIVKQIVEETKKRKKIESQTLESKRLPSEYLPNKEDQKSKSSSDLLKKSANFFKPITRFVDDYPWQFATLILTTMLITFFALFLPFRKLGLKDSQSDEIDLSEHIIKKVDSKPEGSVLNNAQYSELKGRLNELYIYKKEEILLSNDMQQSQKDRALISLEWRFNQILNFSLPKLDTKEAKIFKDGVKELLEERESREVIHSFLRDIIQSEEIDEKRREFLKNSLFNPQSS